MKIAVLGSGHIGGTLAKKWVQAGHTIQFGARDPQKPELQELVKSLGGKASASSIEDAIQAGDVVLFAIPGQTMAATITANAKILDGKIVIDAANNMTAPVSHSIGVFTAQTPNAKAYRAFNSYGWENFEEPVINGETADQFYTGPDGDSRTTVETLIKDIGLEPMYLGGPDQSDVLDGVLKLWFTLVRGRNMGRHLAFKVLRG